MSLTNASKVLDSPEGELPPKLARPLEDAADAPFRVALAFGAEEPHPITGELDNSAWMRKRLQAWLDGAEHEESGVNKDGDLRPLSVGVGPRANGAGVVLLPGYPALARAQLAAFVASGVSSWDGPLGAAMKRHFDALVDDAVATGHFGEAGADFRRWVGDIRALLTMDEEDFDPELRRLFELGVVADLTLYVGLVALARALEDVLGFSPGTYAGVSSGLYHALGMSYRMKDVSVMTMLGEIRRKQTEMVEGILASKDPRYYRVTEGQPHVLGMPISGERTGTVHHAEGYVELFGPIADAAMERTKDFDLARPAEECKTVMFSLFDEGVTLDGEKKMTREMLLEDMSTLPKNKFAEAIMAAHGGEEPPQCAVVLIGTSSLVRSRIFQTGAQVAELGKDGMLGIAARLFARGPPGLKWDALIEGDTIECFEIRG